MKSEYELLNAINHCREVCETSYHRLHNLADALYCIGMRDLADKLVDIAGPLPHVAQEVSAQHSIEQSRHLAYSEAMMGNLLMATIEGVIVPKKKGA